MVRFHQYDLKPAKLNVYTNYFLFTAPQLSLMKSNIVTCFLIITSITCYALSVLCLYQWKPPFLAATDWNAGRQVGFAAFSPLYCSRLVAVTFARKNIKEAFT